MLAGEHEGLSLQIEVPGIEGAVFFGANFCHDGSGDVACVVQNEFKGGGVDPNGAVQAGKFPSDCAVVDRTVGIEGIIGATELAALTSHDVDRIVKKGLRQGGSTRGHQDLGADVGGSDERERANMIVVSVRD
jgi:hypothetical protein